MLRWYDGDETVEAFRARVTRQLAEEDRAHAAGEHAAFDMMCSRCLRRRAEK